MALKHLGTNANNSIATSLTFVRSGMSATDVAALRVALKDDITGLHPTVPGAFTDAGLLFVPRRGVLQMLPGDVVGVDSRGWPILLSADTIASGPWTYV